MVEISIDWNVKKSLLFIILIYYSYIFSLQSIHTYTEGAECYAGNRKHAGKYGAQHFQKWFNQSSAGSKKRRDSMIYLSLCFSFPFFTYPAIPFALAGLSKALSVLFCSLIVLIPILFCGPNQKVYSDPYHVWLLNDANLRIIMTS